MEGWRNNYCYMKRKEMRLEIQGGIRKSERRMKTRRRRRRFLFLQ